MKLLKKYNNKLFATYFLIVFITVLILGIYFENTMTKIYETKSEENILQTTENMKNNMESYFLDMDRMAIQLLTNEEVNEALYLSANELSEQEKLKITTTVETEIMNIISPLFEIRRASIFDENHFYSIGLAQIDYRLVTQVQEQIATDILQSENIQKAIISGVHDDYWSTNGGEVISLFRVIETGKVQNVIEIQRFYEEFKNDVVMEKTEENRFVYVINENNEILYTSMKIEEFGESENAILESLLQLEESETAVLELDHYYYKMVQVEKYGLKFVVAQPKEELMQYYYTQRQYLIIIVIFLVVFLLFASWYLSRKMTKPLNQIKNEMGALTLDNIHANHEMEDSDLDEMHQVYEVFKQMNLRLSESIDQLVESKQLEFRAQCAALQSQIAPHFIGNTLTIIGAKGYENGIPVIDEMCVLLSSMMAYVTKQNDFETTIEKEIQYTKNYLELIGYRYEKRFFYEIAMEKELADIVVPMLIIQPIVENSILHGFTPDMERLDIKITVGYDGPERWKIVITDNGQGFTKKALEKFEHLVELYKVNQNIFQGFDLTVGLFNAYVRVKMVYGESTLWEIQSNSTETDIVIGGSIHV